MREDASSTPPDPEATPSHSGSSSSGILRWVLYGLGGLVLLVLVAAVALPQLFPPERLKRLVVPQVEQAVQRDVSIASIRLRVLPVPTVRVTDFAVANDSAFAASDAFGGDPAVEGQALNIDLALWPLFTGTIEPTAIELVGPVVRYQVMEDGTTNFDSFAAADTTAPADTSESAGLPIAISNVQLTSARLVYDDRSAEQWADLGFDGRLRAVPGETPESIDSDGAFDLATLRYVSAPGADTTALQNATLRYDVGARLAEGRLDVRDLTLETPPLGLAASGSISDLDADRPVVDLNVTTTEADLAQLAAIVPGGVGEGVSPRGQLSLDLQVRGPLPDSTSSDGFDLGGTGRLAGLGVDVDGTTMLQDLGADLALSLDSLAVSSIDGQLLGKPLTGRMTVRDLLGEPGLDGQLAGAADLAQLSALAAEDDGAPVDIAGAVDYDVRIQGPATDPDGIRVRGPVRLSGVRLPNETLRNPLEIDAAALQLTGTGLTADRFTMRTGDMAMQLGVTVRDLLPVSRGLAEANPAVRVSFTLSSERIDLVALYPEEDADVPTYADLFTAQLAGISVGGRSPEDAAAELYGDIELPAFRVDGRVEIVTLLNEPQRFDELTFDVDLRNRRLRIPNLSAQTYGGTLTGSLTLDQSPAATSAYVRPRQRGSMLMADATGAVLAPAAPLPQPDTPTALTYNFELQDAKASAFLRDWTTLGSILDGTLNLSIDGESPLTEGFLPIAEALTAGGRSIVADGGFSPEFGLPGRLVNRLGVRRPSFSDFRQFGGPFTIENGELRVGEWSLNNPQVSTTMSGALGLGGRVDLQLQSEMPLAMIRGSNLSSGGTMSRILDRLGGSDDRVPVAIAVGGTMSDPTVQVDTGALETALKDLLPRGIRRLID